MMKAQGDERPHAGGRERGGAAQAGESVESESLVRQRREIVVVDREGSKRRGQAIVAGGWCPSLAELEAGGGEEFRIVILSEPVPEPPAAVAAGVAICTPGGPDFIGEGVLRETAVAYKTRPVERPDEPAEASLTLSPQDRAALAGGQILATPPLEVSPADIFPLAGSGPAWRCWPRPWSTSRRPSPTCAHWRPPWPHPPLQRK